MEKGKDEMKKTLIAMLLLTALLCAACGTAAPTPTVAPVPTELPAPVPTDDPEMEPPMEMPSYIANQVTVLTVQDKLFETTQNPEEQENREYVVNYTIQDDTLIFDQAGNKLSLEDVKEGSLLNVYTGAYTPAPMIMPPQYQANIIILLDPEAEEAGFTCADTFILVDGMLTGTGNTLALNLTEDVEIVDRDGNPTQEELVNKDLLVFYGTSTRSIPAQTTPTRIVVLGTNELALGSINAQ